MSARLIHRGPDDEGVFVDAAARVAFGFRRLAIIDLSPAGHQPMTSASGRYVVMLNGEIYNFRALRAELQAEHAAPCWRGHSDTEVLLAHVERRGLEGAVRGWIGMFAIALWDRREQALHLVRDRIGVKPLYHARFGDTLLFASQLDALAAHPAFRGEIDRESLELYARYGYVPSPRTIYRHVWKQPPATILTLHSDRVEPEVTTYWSAAAAAQWGVEHPFTGDEEEACEQLEVLIADAVRLRMEADVPLGVFLSGGVDSSLVAAMAQRQSGAAVKTFAIGFPPAAFDEAPHAAVVASHLGTDHRELYVSAREALDTLPLLPRIFDEPFADPSQIPTFLVARLARREVTVSLTGDGGDELFGGYRRHFLGRPFLHILEGIPPSLRSLTARALDAVPAGVADRLFALEGGWLPRSLRHERGAELLRQVSSAVRGGPDALYRQLVSRGSDLVLHTSCNDGGASDRLGATLRDPTDRMMLWDQLSYLPDDLLVKVDRASMAVSLEAREPLLDHRLVELSWQLPLPFKVAGGEGKRILRRLLGRHLPPALVQRPKQGFSVPLADWLRGPLRDWAESLLDPGRVRAGGFFDAARLHKRWQDHLQGQGQWHHHLWIALMFQAWHEERR